MLLEHKRVIASSFIYMMLIAAGSPTAWPQVPAPARVWMPFTHLGVGAALGSTGAGLEISTPLSAYVNLRTSLSYLTYSRTIYSAGFPVQGHLQLGGARATYDWFPKAGSFHLSVGISAPTLTKVNAEAVLAPNQEFTVNGVAFRSDPSNPLRGSGHVTVNKVAPAFTIGWGNVVPRDYRRHFTAPTELGVIYQGAPRAIIAVTGGVCDDQRCMPVRTATEFNQNLDAFKRDLNRNLSTYGRFYPVLSTGFAYRF
jgi:hypothetical protein